MAGCRRRCPEANRIDSHFNFKVVSLSSFASSLPFPLSLIYDYGKINQLLVELAQTHTHQIHKSKTTQSKTNGKSRQNSQLNA